MNCDQVKEQLELFFGLDELPEEVERHLEGCESCRSHREELRLLSERLGEDADFEPSASDLEATIAGVESRIESVKRTSIVPVSWLRQLSRVAAAVLIVAVSYTTYRIGQSQAPTEMARMTDTVEEESFDSAEMDDYFVSILIQDFSSGGYFEAGELLLEDLTDEELEYLTEHMTVGDLL